MVFENAFFNFLIDLNEYRDNVRLEWNVNITGVDANAKYRIQVEQYYETVPDEGSRDNYCPRSNDTHSDPDTAMKIMHKVSDEVFKSPNMITQPMSIASKIWKWGKQLMPYAAAGFGALRTMSGIGTGIGSMGKVPIFF